MIEFVFDEHEAAQAAAHVLRRHGGPLHRDILIRILYYVDRRCLVGHGYPVTGARFVCTADGPALEELLDLTKPAVCSDRPWYRYISPADGPFVAATDETDEGMLSLSVCRMLDETTDTLASLPVEEVCMRSRQLQEWRMIDDRIIPVILDDIFRADALDPLTIVDIDEKASASAAGRKMFGR